jgi:hypothetical protein
MSKKINSSKDHDISLEKLVAAHLQRYLASAKQNGMEGIDDWAKNVEDANQLINELENKDALAIAFTLLNEMHKERSHNRIQPRLKFKKPEFMLRLYRNVTITCVLIGMMASVFVENCQSFFRTLVRS